MNQRTHAWIAIRAIKLLEDEGQVPGLIELLKPFTQEASIGAWIPDKRDAKLGSAQTQNHIFKIGVYKGDLKSRYILQKDKLLDCLGPERLTTALLDKYNHILDATWWGRSYKADPPPGKHLANRAMALSINNIDMLILGDSNVQNLIPGTVGFIQKVPEGNRCTAGQTTVFFYMLSHFIADSLMPCHCDKRDLSDYSAELHHELETHWSKKIGTYFDEDRLCQPGLNDDDILMNAGNIDNQFGINFQNKVPAMKSDDVWEEVVMLCRASFAVASIIAPPDIYPYRPDPQLKPSYETLFEQDQAGRDLLAEIDRVIMHDAVLNVAILWKYIWNKFS